MLKQRCNRFIFYKFLIINNLHIIKISVDAYARFRDRQNPTGFIHAFDPLPNTDYNLFIQINISKILTIIGLYKLASAKY